MELYKKPAYLLSEMIKKKECSAVEITQSFFNRIGNIDEKIGAYITLNNEGALKAAKVVDEKIAKGEAVSPIAGVPIGIKDNISTKGLLTTCASKMLYNYVPPFNATVMEKLISNDSVILGKLNMDEFAMGSSTESSYFKLTRNPHNLDKVPGGSSGGSAASVAAGECAFALGTDTGGSIRMPAAYCGVVGLKPTYGTVSRYGVVAFASSFDQVGPISRNVKDIALLYNAICGYDKLEATSVKKSYPDFTKGISGNVKGLRIGIPAEYFGKGVDSEVKEKVLSMVKELEKQGAKVIEINLPSTEYALSAYYIISSAEASSNLARFDGVRYGYRAKEYDNLIDMYEKTRDEGFGDEVKRRIMLGTFVLSSGYFDAYYKKAKVVAQNITKEFNHAFEECDVIATPTTPVTAFNIGENINDPVKMCAGDICTVPINIAGLPAISVPCGTICKMPVGIQFIANKFNENILLNTARAVELINGEAEVCEISGQEGK